MAENLFPVSFAQQRLWFLDQIEPGSAAYNLPWLIRIMGNLNVPALTAALNALVVRQDALRTLFFSLEGEPRQSVLSALAIDLPVVDLSHIPDERREEEALRIAAEESRRPFELASGPLLRVTLIKVGREEHILVLAIHHIVTDGWSMSIFFRELGALYEASTDDRPPDLPELAIRYRDFVDWQTEYARGGALQPQIEYWIKKLQGSEATLDVPTDRPRQAIQSSRGASERFFLSEETAEELKCLCQSEGATLFMVLLAAFQSLLWRYTSQDNVLVGTPVAGRNELELENLIGFFVNTLVMRADFSRDDMTFRELLKQVRSTCVEAYANQDVPFEKLVEELKPERSLSHTPLFQVMLILQNAPRQRLQLADLVLEQMEFESGIAKFDLTLEIFEEEGLHCTFEYNSDLFESATIRRMIVHFENLVDDLIRNPDTKISALKLLAEAERQRILVDWNDTSAEFPDKLTIHAAFEQAAARTPEAAAFLHEGKSLTYRDLNERANRLARYLIQGNVRPGDLVGISIEPSFDMVVAILGVLKAGAAYVPLEPSEPVQRLALMLEDSGVDTIIARQEARNRLPEHKARLVLLDREKAAIDALSAADISLSLPSTALAYVIYTSGSTGAPKGVEGTHRAAMNRFAWMWKAYPFQSGETCCQKTALSFIDSVWELFGPMLQGVRNVILPKEALLDPRQFMQLLNECEATRLLLVPSLLRMLLDHCDHLGEDLPRLRLWSVSGEVLSGDLACRFLKAAPRATLLNIYGSSEVAADVTWHEVKETGPEQESAYSIPIGRPISNTQIYILDRHLAPVATGVRGEIHVGGAGLARGYWNKPNATAERFIGSPFDRSKSTLLYKTGDFGRFLPDGTIEYSGRTDNQVKIRGMRVELEEVESVIRAHPLVKDVAVVVTDARNSLAAYVIASEGATPLAAQLRRFAHSKLAEHMVPSHYVLVESLPVLSSGKINRKLLQSRELISTSEQAFVAPRTEVEETLVKIWSEVLKLKRVGVEDNFFELGGHSLVAVQVISRIRRMFDVEISVRSIFEEPTIGSLAEIVTQAKNEGRKALTPILMKPAQPGNKEMLMAQLDKLSPEEIRALLEQLKGRESSARDGELNGADHTFR